MPFFSFITVGGLGGKVIRDFIFMEKKKKEDVILKSSGLNISRLFMDIYNNKTIRTLTRRSPSGLDPFQTTYQTTYPELNHRTNYPTKKKKNSFIKKAIKLVLDIFSR
jgi:hypothetical protein